MPTQPRVALIFISWTGPAQLQRPGLGWGCRRGTWSYMGEIQATETGTGTMRGAHEERTYP